MATLSGGEKLERYLETLAKKVNTPGTLQVGFFAEATYPNEAQTSVPLVAFVNEFGRPSIGQPPRPFFRRMIAKEKSHWGNDLKETLVATDYNAKEALAAVGRMMECELQRSIDDLMTPPLKQSTIARKHGVTKPLINTGFMWDSVTSKVK